MLKPYSNLVQTKNFRKKLRKTQTRPEQLLWFGLRKSNLNYKFRRQYGIGRYIIDFYCQELRLAIEVDGITHEDKIEYEEIRNSFLKSKGIVVLHFRSEEIFNNLDNVVENIYYFCEELKKK